MSPRRPTAEEVIRLLELEPHPEEGGYFRETYRSEESTAIYYLLTPDTVSAMHRLPGDEVFHFYRGDPVEMLLLDDDGPRVRRLGSDPEAMALQQVVPGGVWQGSRLVPGGAWALMGTTMAPPFRYEDYEPGTEALLGRGGPHEALLEALLP